MHQQVLSVVLRFPGFSYLLTSDVPFACQESH